MTPGGGSLPYRGAQFLIIHAMTVETAQNLELAVVIDRTAKTMTIDKIGDRRQGEGAREPGRFLPRT
jgi:hypothetical protein